jgi:hypothetical protein
MCVTVDHFNEALVAGNYPELREQYNALLAPWLPGDGPRVFGPLPDGAVIEIDQGGAP